MTTIKKYCALLKDNVERPIEIVLCGPRHDSGNIYPHTDIEVIKTLAALIKVQATQTVRLSLIDLTSTVAYTAFASCLAGSFSIESLTVNCAFFGDNELRELIPALTSNCGMANLTVTNARITLEGMRLLRPFISGCITLSGLTISLQQWTADIAQEITEALLLREKDLDALELTGGLSSSGIELITQVEVKREINLSHNSIGDIGADLIASNLLTTWSNLSSLNISDSNIGNSGVRVIAEALSINRHLKTLDFSNNPDITDVGGREIYRCIYNTESFTSLINSNHILASCCFNGCQLTRKMKRRIGYFCGINMPHSTSREAQLIQRKVIAFMDEKKDGSEISSLDLKLMPNVLSIIEKNCDFATFHKIMMTWNFPQLFANPHPKRIIKELREQLQAVDSEVQRARKENTDLQRLLEAKDREIAKLKRQKCKP